MDFGVCYVCNLVNIDMKFTEEYSVIVFVVGVGFGLGWGIALTLILI